MKAFAVYFCATRTNTTGRIIHGVIQTLTCRFVKELDGGVGEKAQLGLGHSYSRAKVRALYFGHNKGQGRQDKRKHYEKCRAISQIVIA